MSESLPEIIPIVIITGFLGAGKTTFLNSCLTDNTLKDAAIIVNEFGDIAIDHDLVRTNSRQIMITTTGCICCTVSSDVRSSLFELFEANKTGEIPYFSRVIIETTGLADPAPIINALTPGAIQAFGLRDHVVAKRFRLASIICCVDAITGEASLNHAFEAIKQVAFASSILLTKTDLFSSDSSIKINHALKEILASINPAAQILERGTTGSFFMRCFEETYSPKHQSEDILGWLAIERLSQSVTTLPTHTPRKRHDGDIFATVLTRKGSITRTQVEILLNILTRTTGGQLLRVKGLINLNEDPDRPIVIQAVQQLIHPPKQLEKWPSEDHSTRLVIIGRGYDEAALRSVFNTMFDASNRSLAEKHWLRPIVATVGLATIAITFAIFQLSSPISKSFLEYTKDSNGEPE